MSVPCSDDGEVILVSGHPSVDHNVTEAFEWSVMPTPYPPAPPTVCTSITAPTTEHLSSPIQESCSEESFSVQLMENSVEQPSLLNSFVTTMSNKVFGSLSTSPPPPPPPPPLPSSQQTMNPFESHSEAYKEVGFSGDSSSDEEQMKPVEQSSSDEEQMKPVEESREQFSLLKSVAHEQL